MIEKFYPKFKDRADALEKLLDIIPQSEFSKPNSMLVAISEGGLVMASEISKRFALPFEYLFSAAICAPKNSECEVAIVSESMDIAINDGLIRAFDITMDFIYGEAKRRHDEVILPSIYKFRKGEVMASLKNRHVILIDDGIETGLRMSAAIKTCARKQAATITIIAPVVCDECKNAFYSLYALYVPKDFVSTKYYYQNYEKLDSAMILELLNAREAK